MRKILIFILFLFFVFELHSQEWYIKSENKEQFYSHVEYNDSGMNTVYTDIKSLNEVAFLNGISYIICKYIDYKQSYSQDTIKVLSFDEFMKFLEADIKNQGYTFIKK